MIIATQTLPNIDVSALQEALQSIIEQSGKAINGIYNFISAMPSWVSAGFGIAFSGAFLFWLLKEVVL